MSSLIIAWFGNVLQFVILYRAFRTRVLRTYPFFYAYVASTTSVVVLWVIHLVDYRAYAGWYWTFQFLTLILGCGVVLEILNHVLSPYSGAERFAKMAGIFAFGGTACLAFVYLLAIPGWTAAGTVMELERDLRTIQAIFLFAILATIAYYGLPMGRNIKGMILGYGIYVGVSLISLAVWAYAGAWLQRVWAFAPPIAFVAALAIWMVSLWSYQPNPVPDPRIRLEADYEFMAARTRRALDMTRSYLTRAARP